MSFCSVIGSPVSLPVMISTAFCSRVHQPRRLSPPADWTQLAPGFRFHPTDEELVRYYLKRKVTSQPIRVDAIAVVDLYRFEPWDLPPLSRLRSRDMEWYFFTSLDRKYATRCCNNRATVDGYWKTTGKDRPVHHRSRIIGMKKTLVYHAGRAPRAQRTNWVMHEYRLEDEDLARQGIQMDGYVLCKVFQKSGPGPQNGAHYGAPFMEEEWEREGEEDNKLVPVNVERGDPLMEPTGQNYVQLDDFFQDTDLGIEPVDVVSLEASPEHEFHDHTENSAILIEEIFKDLDSVDNTLGAEFFAQHDSNIAWNGIVANNCLEDQLNFVSIQNNGYVQLSDIFDKEKSGSTCNLCPLHLLDGSAGGELCHSNNLPINNAVGSLVSNDLTIEPDQLRVVTSVNNGLCLHPDNLDTVLLEDLSYQVNEENLIYHDAFQNLEAVFTNESFSEFDHLDDLMAFHDATQENLDYVSPGSSQWQFDLFNSSEVQSNASAKVVGSSNQSSKEVHVQESLATHATLERAPNTDGPSNGQCINFTDTSDVKSKHYQESPFTRRLVSMLDSISAPPAFADESAVFVKGAKLFTSAPGSALHVTVPMLQMHDITQMGCAKSLGKHTEMGFFLSYGMGCSILSNSVVHEPRKKVHFGLLSVVLRGGFHLFFLCALLLAFSYKVGVLVYDL